MNTPRALFFIFIFSLFLLLLACNKDASPVSSSTQGEKAAFEQKNSSSRVKNHSKRWYSEESVILGEKVFLQNCIRCHGIEAKGITANWRKPLPGGNFPPPPLNGTAHTWHHPMSLLLKTVREGNDQYGGNMPAFARILNDEEQLAVIAYIQSLWKEDIYASWQAREAR